METAELPSTDNDAAALGCGPLLSGMEAEAKPLRQRILERVRAEGRISRAEVAKSLEISPGSVTTLTAELMQAGLLVEHETALRDSARGRPPVAVGVAPQAHYVVGIKLSDAIHTAVVTDFAGQQLAEATLPSAALKQDTETILAEAETLFDLALTAADLPRDRISAVGMCMPGLVDHATGRVHWSPILIEENQPFADFMSKRIGVPVAIDNDANLVTLAELWFGKGRTMSDFAVVTIEHGVGMGLVLSNQLFRGSLGMGLELGHTKVQIDGALCRCGQRGCLEAYVADYALVREASTALDWTRDAAETTHHMLESLFDQAKAGNEAARSIFNRAGRFLALGLANVAQLFDPQLIILSGERMRYDLLFAEDVLGEMKNLTLRTGRPPPKIEINAWGDWVWARGAAALALSELTDHVMGNEWKA